MRAETSYMTLLAGTEKYAIGGDTLTLFDSGGNESLIYTAAAAE
jgi:heat shock protein HslJ